VPPAGLLTAVASLVIAFIVAQVPPVVASGANLSDAAQADYARNVWRSARPWVALAAAMSPLVIYAVWRFLMFRRKGALGLSLAALFIAGLFALEGISAYQQPPIPVTGKVSSFQGRDISQCGFPTHHLLISDSELRAAHAWVKPGVAVLLYLTPGGDAAYLGPTQTGSPCVTSPLGY
jgi:hypothetical protein